MLKRRTDTLTHEYAHTFVLRSVEQTERLLTDFDAAGDATMELVAAIFTLQCLLISADQQLAVSFVATFTVFTRRLGMTRMNTIDGVIRNAIKNVSAPVFEILLQVISRAMALAADSFSPELYWVIYLAGYLCCNAPEQAAQIAREHTRQIISLCINGGLVTRRELELQHLVLHFVDRICHEKVQWCPSTRDLTEEASANVPTTA